MINFFLLSSFWFIRQTKATLFWLYLWQLKEYHIGRFIDHFRTEKGKRLLLNKLSFFKLFLLFLLFTTRPVLVAVYFLLIGYLLEAGKTLKDFFQKKLKKPVLTKKITFLILVAIIFQALFLFFSFSQTFRFLISLLLFDILSPAIISGIVLFFQPLTGFWRWQVIKKAKRKREKLKDLLVIGITGSYGKTSTKEFLAEILSEKFNVLKTAEHQNSEVGISQCILNDLKPEHEIFVVEMGAYNRGGIKLLSDITKPKIGILTGINEQHMATFGSQENIIRTKFELIDSLPGDGIAIFNGTNAFIINSKSQIINRNLKSKIFCSTKEEADFWAEDIKVEREWVSFKVLSRGRDTAEFKVNLFGAQNVENILLATACAKELGMTLKEIAKACEKIKSSQSGMELTKRKDGLNIIDATYSANPNGVISHLDYLKIWPGKKVIVMPCLIELGSSSIEVHKRIGERIGEICDLAIITTKERFKEIKKGALKSGLSQEKIFFIENSKQIFERIKSFCGPGDIVLLESRVPKQLINLLTK